MSLVSVFRKDLVVMHLLQYNLHEGDMTWHAEKLTIGLTGRTDRF